jgi:hypothetical protein
MAPKRYNGRRAEIYFPSEKLMQEWKDDAKKARLPLSSWIFATVEANRAALNDQAIDTDRDLQTIREENRRLRRDLESLTREHEHQKAELFKLKNEIFAKDRLAGCGEFDQRLVTALKSGGSWPPREILAELQVDQRDADAIQIVTRQLHVLQDLGLVQEGLMGWRWIG